MGFAFVPQGRIAVPPIPFESAVTLEARSSAIIVVDMQNDFVREGGALSVPSAPETVAGIAALLDRGRQSAVRIVYTQDTHGVEDPEFAIWPCHCVEGSWGWEIVADLRPAAGDVVIRKNRYDGFYGTPLAHFLQSVWEIGAVVVVGTVASICVLHTAGSAGLRWIRVVAAADGMSALTEFDQALALHQISSLYAGRLVRSTADIQFTGA